jgi:hypothetical protein
MLTNGFRRIRLTLPDPSAVMTNSRSLSVANHTGVATPEPSRRKLVMLRYLPGIRATWAAAGAAARSGAISLSGLRTGIVLTSRPAGTADRSPLIVGERRRRDLGRTTRFR